MIDIKLLGLKIQLRIAGLYQLTFGQMHSDFSFKNCMYCLFLNLALALSMPQLFLQHLLNRVHEAFLQRALCIEMTLRYQNWLILNPELLYKLFSQTRNLKQPKV